MSSQGRRYRLEIAVKRLHGLVNMSSLARIIFVVRFSSFPEIFIRPHISGGGGVVVQSSTGDGILSLTYNVCHKAEFCLTDDECREMFPAQCVCRMYDEGQRQASVSWVCPCPLLTAQAAEGRRHSNYAMCDGAGKTMGFAEMSCRVIHIDERVLSSLADPGANSPSVVSGPVPPSTPTAKLTVNGKPYVIRVVVDGTDVGEGKKRRHRRTQGGHQESLPENSPSSGAVIAVDGKSAQKNEEKRTGDCRLENADECGQRKRGSASRKKTLLHILQYDVACQIQSNCEMLYATLRREFTPLDAVNVNAKTKPVTEKADCVVQRILQSANVVIQIANQLAESSGQEHTSTPVEDHGRRQPVNNLPLPREGSVAHFLTYQVLFQLQCLGMNLHHITTLYRRAMDVRLSTLHSQHLKFIKKLCLDVQELTKCINIIVQSTIDRSNGDDKADSKSSKTTYSSHFTSGSSSSESSSSLLSSGGRSTRRISSTVESVSSPSTAGSKLLATSFSLLTPSTSRGVSNPNVSDKMPSMPSPQGYSFDTSLPSSASKPDGQAVLAATEYGYNPSPTFDLRAVSSPSPVHTINSLVGEGAANKVAASDNLTNPPYIPASHAFTAPWPPLPVIINSGTDAQQKSSPGGSSGVPVPVPQATQPVVGSTSTVGTDAQHKSSLGGSSGVPVPVPVRSFNVRS
ncbi:hypothetical protein MOQ_004427 [Trypanosoma cruzi marinkellei]|uniref:Uncharacterized protein n=1 Tax=Trypanosoma cruzi marinkellei TaxID=85056 RepID=K2NA23_TRYCR|nr:hypothetical protein MOQ_004427 [Trypanosoma cruzi marinkellei]